MSNVERRLERIESTLEHLRVVEGSRHSLRQKRFENLSLGLRQFYPNVDQATIAEHVRLYCEEMEKSGHGNFSIEGGEIISK